MRDRTEMLADIFRSAARILWLDALTLLGVTAWCNRCRLGDSVYYRCTCSKRKETRNVGNA